MRIPGTKRTARAPDGRRWRVGRRWTSSEVVRLRKRRRQRRERERDEGLDTDLTGTGQRSDADGEPGDLVWDQHGGSGSDVGDGGGAGGGGDGGGGGGFDVLDIGDELAIGLAIVVLVGLLFFLVFPLVEAVVFLLLLAGSVASRVVLRRPWRVEARLLDGDKPRARAHWEVVGMRGSGRVARAVAEHIEATGELPRRPVAALEERTAER